MSEKSYWCMMPRKRKQWLQLNVTPIRMKVNFLDSLSTRDSSELKLPVISSCWYKTYLFLLVCVSRFLFDVEPLTPGSDTRFYFV